MPSDPADEETAQPQILQPGMLNVDLINAISVFNNTNLLNRIYAIEVVAETEKIARDDNRENWREEREYEAGLLKRHDEKGKFRKNVWDWFCATTAVIGVVFLAWILYILGAWLRKISA
ncbi:hypothetical protein B0H67DRAFT_642765 [Lasiosphaeris hirsuta]|uniref:Uncharacterized protein n=1 Tax=Lasiosphaeris hirsuta TaxID=260670 RepID=A0AA40DZJ4_9PEZI|nr:hypothetical protein B0H67DRAFT_642765 [Lasiosphaeris hirsuta]